jgi:hypothetical protein
MGRFDVGATARYDVRRPGNGVYAFVVSGSFRIAGSTLDSRDGMGIWNVPSLDVEALTADAEVLLMDVPMVL